MEVSAEQYSLETEDMLLPCAKIQRMFQIAHYIFKGVNVRELSTIGLLE